MGCGDRGGIKDWELHYNPDWAVLVEEDGAQRLYFVVETKSSLFTDDLRDKETSSPTISPISLVS